MYSYGGAFMREASIEERAVALAQYIIDSKDTVHRAAKKLEIQSQQYTPMYLNCNF